MFQYSKIPSLFEYTCEVHYDISEFDASLNPQYQVLLKVHEMYWCNLAPIGPSSVEVTAILCISVHTHPQESMLLLCILQILPMWASCQHMFHQKIPVVYLLI